MDAAFIKQALFKYFERKSGHYVCFDEMRLGAGWECERTMDFFALNTWKPYDAICCEIKISRADFCAELRQPEKRMIAQALCTQFVFVTPPELVRAYNDSLPKGCELWWCYEDGRIEEQTRYRRAAAPERLVSPGWSFVAALARRVIREEKSHENKRG